MLAIFLLYNYETSVIALKQSMFVFIQSKQYTENLKKQIGIFESLFQKMQHR